MGADKPVSWIDDGEKYALVGLSVKTQGNIPNGIIAPGFWCVTDSRFEFPSHWIEWLGTTRSGEVAHSNVFLLSKVKSERLDVLDGENQTLQHRVTLFYFGLLLASTFSTVHKPVILTGSRRGAEVDVRQQGDFEIPV